MVTNLADNFLSARKLLIAALIASIDIAVLISVEKSSAVSGISEQLSERDAGQGGGPRHS